MLPASWQIPGAIILVIGGFLACFWGYRLFRVVLAIYGFILGAMIATSVMAPSETLALVVAALVGGVVGAFVLVVGYFVGVALIGAGLGALVVHAAWSPVGGDPHPLFVIVVAILGAIAAVVFQRVVIIVATALGGSWTMVSGALALAGSPAAQPHAAATNVWIWYPLNPMPGRMWALAVWLVLGILGVVVQLKGRAKR